MPNKLPREEIRLVTNRPLRLNNACGLGIACTQGTVWITIAGEAGDVFLSTGQRHILTNNRLALIEAVSGSGAVCLHPPVGRLRRLIDGVLDWRQRYGALGRRISGERI